MLAWDAETGEPLSPIVVWQDKRSQEMLDELGEQEDEEGAQRASLDPYFSAAQARWLSATRRREEARAAGAAADGDGRPVPLRPARRGVRDRPADRVAHAAPALDSRLRSAPVRALRGADGGPPESATPPASSATAPRRAGPSSCPPWPGRRSAGGARGGGCVEPGRVKATYGTGVFVLAHVGDQVPEPAGACCRRSPGASAASSSTARRQGLRGGGDLRVDVQRARHRERPA